MAGDEERYEPFFDSTPPANVPTDWIPNPPLEKKAPAQMQQLEVGNMAEWIQQFEEEAIKGAVFLLKDMIAWWKAHQSAARIVIIVLEKHNIRYTGKQDHTWELSALAVLVAQCMKNKGIDVLKMDGKNGQILQD